MKRLLISGLVVAGLTLSGVSSFAVETGGETDSQTQQEAYNLSKSEQEFVVEAAQGGMLEVELGELATERAASDDVKEFGGRMVKDHSKVDKELTQLASDKGVTLPKEMNAKHKETLDRLSKLSGAEFDRAYMNEMVKDHTKDVESFRLQSEQAKDSDLKEWTAETLPTLQDHLQQARNIAGKVGADQES